VNWSVHDESGVVLMPGDQSQVEFKDKP
jgi:hypothetical protein